MATFLASCGSDTKPPAAPAEAPRKADAPKVSDETRRFPRENLVDAKVIGREMLGKPFMPGGTLATYKKGKVEYQMFLAKCAGAEDPALLLLDWKKALVDAKFVPSFGGYFGNDGTRPVFVFPKGQWIAGVAGLPEKEAGLEARTLASRVQ